MFGSISWLYEPNVNTYHQLMIFLLLERLTKMALEESCTSTNSSLFLARPLLPITKGSNGCLGRCYESLSRNFLFVVMALILALKSGVPDMERFELFLNFSQNFVTFRELQILFEIDMGFEKDLLVVQLP